jgi:hypothetical protein
MTLLRKAFTTCYTSITSYIHTLIFSERSTKRREGLHQVYRQIHMKMAFRAGGSFDASLNSPIIIIITYSFISHNVMQPFARVKPIK